MSRVTMRVNGTKRTVEADTDTPLLWVLRDRLGLKGTKFGCGVGVCGACTIHEDGHPVRACQVPLQAASGRSYTTIEGLGAEGLHPCQKAWIEEDVAQCGYCQPGMIMEVAACVSRGGTAAQALEALASHVCRCGTYGRIRKAVDRLLGGSR